jgi:Flp pilus assembly protein CpaB
MVTTTRPPAAAPGDGIERASRTIERRSTLPGGRAALGGLLMAIAAVGVFLAYTDATRGPTGHVIVADRELRAGETIAADDLRRVTAQLPGDAGTFEDASELVGRAVLGPIGAGEIVQAGSVTDDRGEATAHEVALTLPRSQIAVGRLKQGERVDVFVTSDDRTTSVVRDARVVQITNQEDGSLTSAREITLVVAVPSGDAVAAMVHALRTGDVTVVRSTFADGDTTDPLVFAPDGDPDAVDDESDDAEAGAGGGIADG